MQTCTSSSYMLLLSKNAQTNLSELESSRVIANSETEPGLQESELNSEAESEQNATDHTPEINSYV